MDRAALLERLHGLEPELRRAGVEALYLFGSRARGDHRPDSDVDLLFESNDPGFSYFDLFRIQDRVSDTLRLPVGLVERRALHAFVKPFVEPDLVQIF